MEIQIKRLKPHAKLFSYAHKGDAGADVYSAEEYLLIPGQRRTISTGIAVAIPEGYVGLVWGKSGIASRNGVTTLAGVIDSGYRGEVGIVLANLGEEPFRIERGMKVAQFLIQKVESVEFIEAEELDQTTRGEGGFGSTGVK